MRDRRTLSSMVVVALVAFGGIGWPRSASAAEDYGFLAISYEPSVPVGALRSFVDRPAYVAMRFEGRIRVADRLTLDIGGAWNFFYERRGRETIPIRNGALTGRVERFAEYASFTPGLHYYFGWDDAVVPYVGVAVGPGLFGATTRVSDLEAAERRFGLVVSPDVGLRIRTSYGRHRPFGILVAGRYTYNTAEVGGIASPSFVTLQVGAFGSF